MNSSDGYKIIARVMHRSGWDIFTASNITLNTAFPFRACQVQALLIGMKEAGQVQEVLGANLCAFTNFFLTNTFYALTDSGVKLAEAHWIDDCTCDDHQCPASECGCLEYIQDTHCHECGALLVSGSDCVCVQEAEFAA